MKAHEVLRAAHMIIADGWSQGANARDAAGVPVQLFTSMDQARINPLATRFSIYGAICKGGSGERWEEPRLMWETLSRRARELSGVPGGNNHVHPIMGFNEMPGQTKEAVLDLLQSAIDELDPPATKTEYAPHEEAV